MLVGSICTHGTIDTAQSAPGLDSQDMETVEAKLAAAAEEDERHKHTMEVLSVGIVCHASYGLTSVVLLLLSYTSWIA